MKTILLLLIFAGFTSICGFLTAREAEEYDEKLSDFIREILENFRGEMSEGIPGVGIPPLDPLSIQNIDKDIQSEMANIVLHLHQLNITGISKFELKLLKADLQRGFVNFSIAIPELVAEGYCYMNGKIIKIFPISSDGPFTINVSMISIDGYGDLNVTSGEETRIHMNDLRLNLTFGPLDIKFESLLGGARWTQTLVKILSKAGPKIFMHFNELIMDKINKALLTLVNEELDKGKLVDILPFPS